MMRLNRLDLDFFGHFTGKTLDFGPPPETGSDFHVIYGANEAGKTTIKEGFLRLLYGFDHLEHYSFMHDRANLRVGGTIRVNGRCQKFTRLPNRSNTLLNADGEIMPETALSAPLAGLAKDDYRKLFCLDEATTEEGGNEIANSKGDIGRLLFSAAAGINDLTAVLDVIRSEADAFYRKGASKTVFAALKREHDELSKQIKQQDVSATGYSKLKQELDAAVGQEAEFKQQRHSFLQAEARLKALAAAHPMFARLTALEEELAPIDHYPRQIDIDPERLVKMQNEWVVLNAEQDRLRQDIAEKTKTRDALELQPDLCKALEQLEALQQQRNRYETALIDLPNRLRERDAARADISRMLQEIGVDATEAPEDLVLPEAGLTGLDRRLQTLRDAEKALKTAAGEVTDAGEAVNRANAAHEDVERAFTSLPDLDALLDRHNAAEVTERFNAAMQKSELADRAWRDALDALACKGRTFDTVPALPMTAHDANAKARDMTLAVKEVAAAQKLSDEHQRRLGELEAQATVLTQTAGLIADDEAARSRARRDTLWQKHKDSLSLPSASAFEDAMRADDATTAARQAQAIDLGELRQIRLNLASELQKCKAADRQLAATKERHDALAQWFERCVAETGLPTDIAPQDLADWTVKAEAAEAARNARHRQRQDAQPDLDAASCLKDALRAALDEPTADLNALITMARKHIARHTELFHKLEAAKDTLTSAETRLQQRQSLQARARNDLKEANNTWSTAITQTFGKTADAELLKDALAMLRRLREIGERLSGLSKRIEDMEADRVRFTGLFEQIVSPHAALASLSVDEALAALERDGKAARKTAETSQRLNADIDEANRRLADIRSILSNLDKQRAALAGIFAGSIETATLTELRSAVLVAQQAIDTRNAIADLTRSVLTSLNLGSRAEITETLAGTVPDETQARLAALKQDIEAIDEKVTAATEARAIAETRLKSVTGESGIAVLNSRRRTLEAEMQAGILRHLELSFGHQLAERAIRVYRDKHRSAMMRAAEDAFVALTNGAYVKLESQAATGGETLVAILAEGGAARSVDKMSSGTRFQLYLALRAAAYEQMAANGTVLPFFCDDVFEKFDDDRTRAACRLMHRIGQTGQAIYLTHHRHVVDIAREMCGENVRVIEI